MKHNSIISVAEDLYYLRSWNTLLSGPEIRRGAVILRRLLLEDSYGKAWRAIGNKKQPKLIAVDLTQWLGSVPLEKVPFSLSGGALMEGRRLEPTILHEAAYAMPKPTTPSLRRDGLPGEKEFYLSEFRSSLAATSYTFKFTRDHIIKYMAYANDGVHSGLNDQLKENQKLFEELDKLEGAINAMGMGGVTYEMLGIGQNLANSDNAMEFTKIIIGDSPAPKPYF